MALPPRGLAMRYWWTHGMTRVSGVAAKDDMARYAPGFLLQSLESLYLRTPLARSQSEEPDGSSSRSGRRLARRPFETHG